MIGARIRGVVVCSLVGVFISSTLAVSAQAVPVVNLAQVAKITPAVTTLCDPYGQSLIVEGKAAWTLTHAHGYQLPPGGSLTVTKSVEKTRVLGVGFSATLDASIGENTIIEKAKAKYKVALALKGQSTKKTSVTVKDSIASSKKDRYYAGYSGNKYWTGTWDLYECNSSGTGSSLVNYGKWHSFSPASSEGFALCPAKRYKKGTLPNKACKLTWT